MVKRRLVTVVAALVMLVMGMTAYAGSKVVFNNEYEPKIFDPQKLVDIQGMEMASACLEGLTRLGEDGKVFPAAAESWSVKGNIWTFKLRKGMKWSNGETITAKDFYFGIKRGIEPDTASEYAYMTYYIKNAQAYNEKKEGDFTKVGVKVVDDYTLQIETEGPTSFLPSIVGSLPIFYPVNEKYYNEHKEKFASEADQMLYNGAWTIKEWQHDNKVVFIKNQNYWNKAKIGVDELVYLMVKDSATAANMYKNNELDVTAISGNEIPQFAGSKEMTQFSEGTTYYIEFNVANKSLSNAKIRKAIAYALDRKILCEKVLRDGSIPATAFVPTGFPGKKKSFREDYGVNLFKDNNVAEAQKLYAQGLKELGVSKITLKLLSDNNDVTQKMGQFIQAQLKKNLGLEVVLEPVTKQIRLQKMGQKDYEFAITRWGADYLDPMTFMDLHLAVSGNNYAGWANKKYDSLIEKAQNSSEAAARMDAMAEAEKLAMDEMAFTPLFFKAKNVLVKPKVKDVRLMSSGNNVEFYWSNVKGK